MKYSLAIACVFILTACSAKSQFQSTEPKHEKSRYNRIFVVSHGWHTGLIIPTDFLVSNLKFLRNRFGKAPYLEFGWGDKDFYQAEEITTGLTLQSALWPTQSVVHVVALAINPANFYVGAEIVTLHLHKHEMINLQTFISNSFYRSESGNVVMQQTGLHSNNQFYTGIDKYHLFNTCNTWTAKGLKSAGLDISSTFKLTAGSVMSFLKSYNQARVVNPTSLKQ